MNQAVLLCASIVWQFRYDKKGRPIGRDMAVSITWMPCEASYKRCGFNHKISEPFTDYMRSDPRQIDIQTKTIVNNFALGAKGLMKQILSESSDVSAACEELLQTIPEGLRSFLTDDQIWIHHFNEVLHVPKGSRYRAKDGEWYEAEEDMMIAVHCGAGDQMMSQADFERAKNKTNHAED